jgi:flagella basal body P-ring formation protein FlgA
MRLLITGLMMICLAGPALAGQAVTMKNDVRVSGPVTLGDLFDDAGSAAGVIVSPPVKSGSLVLDAVAVQRAASRAGLDWTNPQDVRLVIVHAGASSSASTPAAVMAAGAPRPGASVQVLAYSRSLEAGEIIQPDDLTWAKAVQALAGAPHDADQLIGKAARRPLREGAVASTRDVVSATVIKKGDMVRVSYTNDTISLTMQGKAVGSAAVGDPVSVLNTATKTTIQAIASGPDQAVVGPEAEQIRAQALLNPSQTALR